MNSFRKKVMWLCFIFLVIGGTVLVLKPASLHSENTTDIVIEDTGEVVSICLGGECINCEDSVDCTDNLNDLVHNHIEKTGSFDMEDLTFWTGIRLETVVIRKAFIKALEMEVSDTFVLTPINPGYVYEVYIDVRNGLDSLSSLARNLVEALSMSAYPSGVLKIVFDISEEGCLLLRMEKDPEDITINVVEI